MQPPLSPECFGYRLRTNRGENPVFSQKQGELPVYPSGSTMLCSPAAVVLEESLFLFSVCGRTLIRVESAAAVPQAVLLPAQSFYTPVGDTALPGRNGTGYYLK